MAQDGRREAGIRQIEEGLAMSLATGTKLSRPDFLCLLADACIEAGRPEDGLRALAEALAAADEHEGRLCEAEVHRLKGELLLRHGNAERNGAGHPGEAMPNELKLLQGADRASRPFGALGISVSNDAEAQTCFEVAIRIARQQGAKSWELRAATSLARLHVRQGCREEARTMLADTYSWFTEGFGTADLKDAKALLDQLNAVEV